MALIAVTYNAQIEKVNNKLLKVEFKGTLTRGRIAKHLMQKLRKCF